MNKQDLKNGMIYQIRAGRTFCIIVNEVYELHTSVNSYIGLFKDAIIEYENDLTHKLNPNNDIMYVYDYDGKLLWERGEQQIDSLINFIKNEDIEVVKEFFKSYGVEFTKTKEPSTKNMRVSKLGREDLEEKIRKIIDII